PLAGVPGFFFSFAYVAATTSSLIAGKVCFQQAAKPTSTADMRRKAAFQGANLQKAPWGQKLPSDHGNWSPRRPVCWAAMLRSHATLAQAAFRDRLKPSVG